jgi:diamine N-acetyltransferase
MMILQNKNILLRALEPHDLNFVYEIENDTTIWNVSNTQTPYSKFLIKEYLKNSHQDIYTSKQLRLVIESKTEKKAVGLIDLFEFDPKNKRVGLGILINNPENRNQKIGSQAVELLINYVFEFLQVHQIFVNINPKNIASVKLFDNFGFQLIGLKKDWNFYQNSFEDEALYQLIKK